MNSKGVYVFDLKLLCGGYAYFSTFTMCVGLGNLSRDIRKPSLVDGHKFFNDLKGLGYFRDQNFSEEDLLIRSQEDYTRWLYRKGWGFASKEYVQKHMQQWLKQHECLCSPLGIFTDISIVPPSTLKQHTHSKVRQNVLERDDQQCLLCGTEENLTMQHVTPYSYGGETTLRNLVTLCNDCNQKCGVEFITELYELAGLHYGYDPSLIKIIPFQEALHRAMYLSKNLMQTRCEVW
jgi:hypothetical protein